MKHLLFSVLAITVIILGNVFKNKPDIFFKIFRDLKKGLKKDNKSILRNYYKKSIDFYKEHKWILIIMIIFFIILHVIRFTTHLKTLEYIQLHQSDISYFNITNLDIFKILKLFTSSITKLSYIQYTFFFSLHQIPGIYLFIVASVFFIKKSVFTLVARSKSLKFIIIILSIYPLIYLSSFYITKLDNEAIKHLLFQTIYYLYIISFYLSFPLFSALFINYLRKKIDAKPINDKKIIENSKKNYFPLFIINSLIFLPSILMHTKTILLNFKHINKEFYTYFNDLTNFTIFFKYFLIILCLALPFIVVFKQTSLLKALKLNFIFISRNIITYFIFIISGTIAFFIINFIKSFINYRQIWTTLVLYSLNFINFIFALIFIMAFAIFINEKIKEIN